MEAYFNQACACALHLESITKFDLCNSMSQSSKTLIGFQLWRLRCLTMILLKMWYLHCNYYRSYEILKFHVS